jgi:hypothetical protein
MPDGPTTYAPKIEASWLLQNILLPSQGSLKYQRRPNIRGRHQRCLRWGEMDVVRSAVHRFAVIKLEEDSMATTIV